MVQYSRRREKMIKLKSNRYTYEQIGNLFGLTRQRVHQIVSGKTRLSMEERRETARKKSNKYYAELLFPGQDIESLGDIIIDPELQGRERTRELVRIRDHHTCQLCGKVWENGNRRFDVHFIDSSGKESRKYYRVKDIPKLITLCHKCNTNRPEHIKTMEDASHSKIRLPVDKTDS